jgi:hypothetical protein
MLKKFSIGNKNERERDVENLENLEIIIQLNLKHKIDNFFWLTAKILVFFKQIIIFVRS